jgi:hypothetical protein
VHAGVGDDKLSVAVVSCLLDLMASYFRREASLIGDVGTVSLFMRNAPQSPGWIPYLQIEIPFSVNIQPEIEQRCPSDGAHV